MTRGSKKKFLYILIRDVNKEDNIIANSQKNNGVISDDVQMNILMRQWETLDKKADTIENGHWMVFTVILTTLSIFSVFRKQDSDSILVFWILPPLLMMVTFYEAQKFF